MKILFAIGFPVPFAGAGWRRIDYFASYFSKRGHATVVLSGMNLSNLRKTKKVDVGRTSVFNVLPTILLTKPVAGCLNVLLSFLFSLMSILPLRPDIIMTSVPPGEPALGVFMACKLLRKKVVFDYRDEWEDYSIKATKSRLFKTIPRFIKRVATTFYNQSDSIAAVTPAFVKSLKRRGVTRIRMIPNGADVGVFRPLNKKTRIKLGLSNNDFTMVYSGIIGLYYKLDTIVEATNSFLKKNGRNGIKLVFFGDGPEIARVLVMARELGIKKHVRHLGVIRDPRHVAEIIACADVGMIPYDDNILWKNTYPSKFFEYCACGVPVIATTYSDSVLAELIQDYQVGLTTPPMDIEGLEKAIEKMYFDRKFREEAGSRGRKLVELQFDRQKIAEELLRLLLDLQDADN